MTNYNTTFLDNSTNLLQIYVGINDNCNSILTILLLVSILIISFVMIKDYDTNVAMSASTFLTLIIGVLFLAMNLIVWEILLIFAVLFFASLMMLIFNK